MALHCRASDDPFHVAQVASQVVEAVALLLDTVPNDITDFAVSCPLIHRWHHCHEQIALWMIVDVHRNDGTTGDRLRDRIPQLMTDIITAEQV